MDTKILEVNKLNKKIKDFALKQISFSLEKGYVMGFIGPNGSGKSTTIKLIMNLMNKDSGEIKVFGLDNTKHERIIKNRIGFVYDENCFNEELNINETKYLIGKFYSNWDNNMFFKYIKEFDLPVKKKIKEFSKGMKMKLSIAIALSHQAELLIMDEPTSGLDPVVRSELLEILSSLLQDENKAVFFSTHITSDLDKIADYITFIDDGEIILSEAKDDILECYGLVKGQKGMLDERSKQQFIGIKENSFGFEGLVKDKQKIKGILKENYIIEKPSLEDIMIFMARRNQNV